MKEDTSTIVKTLETLEQRRRRVGSLGALDFLIAREKGRMAERAVTLPAVRDSTTAEAPSSKVEALSFEQQIELARSTGHFHKTWYLTTYQDVGDLGKNPLAHYLREGAKLGFNPGKNFDTQFYLRTYPDAAASGLNPLVHFALYGKQAGYATKPKKSEARKQINVIRTKLLSLGFTERPLAEFTEIATTSDDPIARAMAARELALWHMRNPLAAALQFPGFAPGWSDDESVRAMLEWVPPFEHELSLAYRAGALSKEPDTFVLYRIVGNDLYPRHERGQSRENVRFILENEPELSGCEKRWVLNRIFDADERQAIITLLEQHHQPYLEIPFEAAEFVQIGWDYAAYPEPGFLSAATFHTLGALHQERVLTAAYRSKNLYLMNNNGARNTALEDGLARAKWVLPWDGNCFVTASAWGAIRAAVGAKPYLPYHAVPMQRITDNADLLLDGFTPNPVEEPQLLFRRDARERFAENHPYGRRPKVDLFWRLGIPGGWDRWKDDPWEQPRSDPSPDAGAWGVAGWVARLASGQAHLEASTTESFKNRGRERQKAIRAAISYVTRQVSAQPDPVGLTCYRFAAIEALRAEYQIQGGKTGPQAGLSHALLRNAAEAMGRQPESPVDKPEPGPSGDRQDYYHPAPYWWPDPSTKDGLPFVRRDGQRVPGTQMYEPESHRYDRTRLQRLFDDCTTLALAAFVTGDSRYSAHALRWLERWFINPATRMNPHLSYAQVRWGHNSNRGFQTGVIEMKDVYYLLDAVRLLRHTGALSSDHLERLHAWFRDYLDWLLTSKQGMKESQARNNHGVYYDLHVASVAAFLNDWDTLFATLIRAEERIPLHITPEGVQHEEMKRTITAHYCCFTLQGWLNLVNLAARFDGTFLARVAKNDHPLRKAVDWLLLHEGKPWPYPQIDDFDPLRFLPIRALAQALGILPAESWHNPIMLPTAFHPHDGVQIYPALALSPKTIPGVIMHALPDPETPTKIPFKPTGKFPNIQSVLEVLPEWEDWYRDKDLRTDMLNTKILPWLEHLSSIRTKKLKILELGVFEGRSTIALLELFPKSVVTAVDKWDIEGTEERFDKNIQEYGQRVIKVKQRAVSFMDEERKRQRKYDLIYQDAGKFRDDTLVQAISAWTLLSLQGFLIFDDVLYGRENPDEKQPGVAINWFKDSFEDCIDILHDGRQLIVRKNRDWPGK